LHTAKGACILAKRTKDTQWPRPYIRVIRVVFFACPVPPLILRNSPRKLRARLAARRRVAVAAAEFARRPAGGVIHASPPDRCHVRRHNRSSASPLPRRTLPLPDWHHAGKTGYVRRVTRSPAPRGRAFFAHGCCQVSAPWHRNKLPPIRSPRRRGERYQRHCYPGTASITLRGASVEIILVTRRSAAASRLWYSSARRSRPLCASMWRSYSLLSDG
jgi:hypothetical protein